jgi:hypothetical protein
MNLTPPGLPCYKAGPHIRYPHFSHTSNKHCSNASAAPLRLEQIATIVAAVDHVGNMPGKLQS